MSDERIVTATEDEERCFREIVAVLKKWADTDPKIQNRHVMAMLGRMAGYCIAMCLPAERKLARRIVDLNIDEGVRATRSI